MQQSKLDLYSFSLPAPVSSPTDTRPPVDNVVSIIVEHETSHKRKHQSNFPAIPDKRQKQQSVTHMKLVNKKFTLRINRS